MSKAEVHKTSKNLRPDFDATSTSFPDLAWYMEHIDMFASLATVCKTY